jgi:hypothetical protein
MKKIMPIRYFHTIILVTVIVSLAGCLEASFELASESRLPKWLDKPEGVSRSDLKVTMDYYSTFSGGEYVFKFYDKNRLLSTEKIKLTTKEESVIRTQQLKNPPEGSPKNYPVYNVVTVNGISDIVERRKMEPVFYMTDDPAIWKELDVKQ